MPELHFEAAVDPALSPKVNKLMRKIRRGRPRDVEGQQSRPEE
jgi:hypothetical protein